MQNYEGDLSDSAWERLNLEHNYLMQARSIFFEKKSIRPFHRASGKGAIVVGLADRGPALSLLAGDVCLAGLALGIE